MNGTLDKRILDPEAADHPALRPRERNEKRNPLRDNRLRNGHSLPVARLMRHLDGRALEGHSSVLSR